VIELDAFAADCRVHGDVELGEHAPFVRSTGALDLTSSVLDEVPDETH
jgi:hypothetical protein